jgi:hypothetical protein
MLYLCPPLRGQATILCHPRWQATEELAEINGGLGSWRNRTLDCGVAVRCITLVSLLLLPFVASASPASPFFFLGAISLAGLSEYIGRYF